MEEKDIFGIVVEEILEVDDMDFNMHLILQIQLMLQCLPLAIK